MKEVRIAKGVRIKGQIWEAYMPALAGMQMKLGVKSYGVTGVVRHIRADLPDPHPGVEHIALFVDPDEGYQGLYTEAPGCTCETRHAMVRLAHLIDVLGEPIPAEQATLTIDIPDPKEES